MKNYLSTFILSGLFFMPISCPTLALAATKTTINYYSVGLYLDDNSCDFGENYEMPDEIDAIFKLSKSVRSSKTGTITKLTLSRSGKFPFSTTLKTVKATSRGFKASGTKTSGAKALHEKISLSAGRGGGSASLTMQVIQAGDTCEYSYSGDAMAIKQ